jgi:sensor histidine kinase YesM
MKIPVPPRHQSIGFWISMPFISWAWNYILFHDRIYHELHLWLVVVPIIYALGYISWRCHYVYDDFIRKKFPHVSETTKRVFAKSMVNIFVMSPSVFLIFLFFHVFHILGYRIQPGDLKYGYLLGLGVNIIFESLWEVIYIIDQNKAAAAEKEMLEQMHLQQEFDHLKQKVNPHFLFNSFNTLSSLISEDKDQAEKFLDELSNVYRYLLRNNESGMSTVEQETAFIRSYSKLLQTRYGEGFKLEMEIDPAYKDRQIPSLSLQLLVENAVKHNVVSRQQPVQVLIRSTKDGYLSVENKMNKKTNVVDSTGIGLSNIRRKYGLLNHDDIFVEEKDGYFKVSIPLI